MDNYMYPELVASESDIDATDKMPMDLDFIDSDSLGWTKCSQAVWENETRIIKNWSDEIDTLLIFAGLFSAVVTAFIVPFYVLLQPQTTSISTADMFAHLSAQLASFVVNGNYINSTGSQFLAAPSTTSVISPAKSMITVNALWLSSLVCTLASASISICVKQWLHRYTNRVTTDPRPSVRVWCHRRRHLDSWWVSPIVSILPILLQVALALFLVGLVVVLWTFNDTVAYTVSVLVGTLLFFVACTATIPAFVEGCPYKSPQAWLVVYIVYWLRWLLSKSIALCFRQAEVDVERTPTDWADFERLAQSRRPPPTDAYLLTVVEGAIKDDSFLTTAVGPYLKASPLRDACEALEAIIEGRAKREAFDKLYRDFRNPTKLSKLGVLVMAVVQRFCKESNAHTMADIGPLLLRIIATLAKNHHPAVFIHLLELLPNGSLSDATRFWIGEILADNCRHYISILDCDHFEKLLFCIPQTLGDHNISVVIWTVMTLLSRSFYLSNSEAHGIRDKLHMKLDALQVEPRAPITNVSTPTSGVSATSLDILSVCLQKARQQVESSGRIGYEMTSFAIWENTISNMRLGKTVEYQAVAKSMVMLSCSPQDAWSLFGVIDPSRS